MIFFYILVLVSAMPNHPLFEAPLAGLTVVKWLGIICCGYAFFRLLSCRRLPAFLRGWEIRSFLVLLGIATVSFCTLSKTENLSFSPIFMYFNYLPLFFTTICVVNTYERLQNALLAAIAGAAVASLYVIREFQASGGTNLRPGYIAGDANYFATCMLLVMPMAVCFVKVDSSRLRRCFCAASLAIMLIAFTLASSRGGLVGLCVAVLCMILRSGQSRRAAIVITISVIPLLILSPASPLSRMLHPNYGDYVGAQVRREFWSAGLDMISSHPITGIGLGNFTAQSVSKEVEGFQGIACNTFLEVAAELGIPGFLAYCAVVAGALFSAGRLRAEGKRNHNAFLQYAGQAIQAGLLGFSAAAVFVSAEYQKPFWIMAALTSAVPTLLRDHSRGSEHVVAQLRAASTSNSSLSTACLEGRPWTDPLGLPRSDWAWHRSGAASQAFLAPFERLDVSPKIPMDRSSE
jgi:putative inorganic carbon (hco3(-)) transporter